MVPTANWSLPAPGQDQNNTGRCQAWHVSLVQQGLNTGTSHAPWKLWRAPHHAATGTPLVGAGAFELLMPWMAAHTPQGPQVPPLSGAQIEAIGQLTRSPS